MKDLIEMKHQLKFDIAALNGKSILEAYPALAAYKEFEEAEDRLLSYVIYGYDKGSAFMKIKDPYARKEKSLLEAGYTKDSKGNWEDDICEMILSDTHEKTTSLVTAYLRIQNDVKFAFYISAKEMIWQNTEKIRKPIDDNDKDKDVQATYNNRNTLFEKLPSQIKTVEDLEKELFPENDPDSIQMVNDYVQQQKPGRVESRLMRA